MFNIQSELDNKVLLHGKILPFVCVLLAIITSSRSVLVTLNVTVLHVDFSQAY